MSFYKISADDIAKTCPLSLKYCSATQAKLAHFTERRVQNKFNTMKGSLHCMGLKQRCISVAVQF